MANINRVVLTGNLTRDPELRSLPSGMAVCRLGVACNGRRKDPSTDSWVDKPNFFDVNVFGGQAENCARYLSKGRPVAVDGRLDWREWQDKEGNKRTSVEIVADTVQFLGSREENGGGGNGGGGYAQADRGNGGGFTPRSDIPVDTNDFASAPRSAPAPTAVADDDIPF